jgi:hypothetical protein
MTRSVKPVFSAKAFLFQGDQVPIDHIDQPAISYRGIVEAGSWGVHLSNGIKEIPVALNIQDEKVATEIAVAKRDYQVGLVENGVFSGTDDILIKGPEGERTVFYKGFES